MKEYNETLEGAAGIKNILMFGIAIHGKEMIIKSKKYD